MNFKLHGQNINIAPHKFIIIRRLPNTGYMLGKPFVDIKKCLLTGMIFNRVHYNGI